MKSMKIQFYYLFSIIWNKKKNKKSKIYKLEYFDFYFHSFQIYFFER